MSGRRGLGLPVIKYTILIWLVMRHVEEKQLNEVSCICVAEK